MISDLFSDWLFDIVAWDLFELVCDDIILLQLVPVLFSLVENNTVSEMEEGSIKSSELWAHDSLVDNDLVLEFAVSLIVVELECLDKLLVVVSIELISLNNWHASLVGLYDLHAQIFDEVFVFFCNQE